MGGQAQSQQQPVFYDSEMGQYYTQSPENNGRMGQQNSFMTALLNNFGINRQQVQQAQQAPYQYADVSSESLFPSMNQGGGNSALAGLLGGAPSATGSASSGAGRFM